MGGVVTTRRPEPILLDLRKVEIDFDHGASGTRNLRLNSNLSET